MQDWGSDAMIDLSEYGRELLTIKANIKQSIRNKGVEIADDVPFSSYPAKIAAIQGGGGAITLAEYDMSALQDNSVIGYLEAVPEGYLQVRIEGTGAMRDYSDILEGFQSPLRQNPMIKKIIVKEGVISIGEYAFYDCTSLTEIVIPDSVTSIGDGAFAYCESLQEIVIPNSVTSIGSRAFAYGNPDLILKPEVLEKPGGWSSKWNAYDGYTFLTVWWGGVPPQQ